MKIVGILTEFNPFHSGHAHLLSELRRKLGEDTAIVCIMSGNFVQRGEPAIMEKHVRAEAALLCGADVILELPIARSIASAESFAHGAIYMMQKTGCITHLAFGSECGDIAKLDTIAHCLNSTEYNNALRKFLEQGLSFAACRQGAIHEILGEESAAVLEQANNNLGIEYLKAVQCLSWKCQAVTVVRRGANHDSKDVGEYMSGSMLRNLMKKQDWETVGLAVPEKAAELYRKAFLCGRAPVTMASAERMILAKLRTMEEEEFAQLPDCGEGLHHRLYQAARKAKNLDDFFMRVKTKRYALSRIRRIVMCAWLGIDREAAEELPEYLRVLGCSVRGRTVLAQMRESAQLPVLVKPADAKRFTNAAQKQFQREVCATEFYSLLYPELAQSLPGQEWRIGPVVLKVQEKS